ncbi:MAG: crossover junction endodeoxyribonuclease RuvC [Spirochaetales bacterium]|nr:crossover junction endodeoxyribonuclease RuvC [Spirochaetales bacterium]
MVILGLDPGLANTGWGVIEVKSNKLSCLDYGSITTSSKLEAGDRLNIIYNQLSQILLKYKPQFAGLESLFFSKNRLSGIPVAQAKGVLLLLLHQHDIPVKEFTPIQIKQNVTGNGAASKDYVRQLTELLLGIKSKITTDHAADALAASICFYNTFEFHSKIGGQLVK